VALSYKIKNKNKTQPLLQKNATKVHDSNAITANISEFN